MNRPNFHNFKINLPAVAEEGSTDIQMDGIPLRGISGLILKADPKGYTNVCIEFNGEIVVETLAAIQASVNVDEIAPSVLIEIYNEEIAEAVPAEQCAPMDKVHCIQKIITAYIEKVNAEIVEEAFFGRSLADKVLEELENTVISNYSEITSGSLAQSLINTFPEFKHYDLKMLTSTIAQLRAEGRLG